MNILIVTNLFPSKKHPYHGIFVKEQIDAISRLYSEVKFDILYINNFKGKWEYLKSIYKVVNKINNSDYDLVHIHYGLSGLYLFNPFIKKVKTLVTFHGSDIQPKGGNGCLSVLISRHTAKMADAAIVLNDEMETMVRPYCERIFQIPCAVDIRTFKPQPRTEKNQIPLIVFPSDRKRQVKNYPLFCEVLKFLKEKYNIKAQIQELKNMSRKEISLLYANSDLLLMTSKSEGSPQVIKEAMACNLPCVSTPVGDVKMLLDNVKDCYVAHDHDVEELATLVYRSLYTDGNGMLGRDKIIMLGVDEDQTAKKLYNIYVELIKGH